MIFGACLDAKMTFPMSKVAVPQGLENKLSKCQVLVSIEVSMGGGGLSL